MTDALDAHHLLDSLPPPWPHTLLPEIQRRIAASAQRFVILDDDPTGQTLHGLPVLAAWDAETLSAELERSPAFFVLTNSRALREPEAVAVARDVGHALRNVARTTARSLVAGYRGDSTLRGHFPAENDALHAAITGSEAARPTTIFAPYFAEGGRFTINDTQYVLQGSRLVPAAETEFARDPRFAYQHSHLPSWLEARTAGRVRARDVVSVSIEDLRIGGPEAVSAKLRTVPGGGVALMNAASDRDVEVFVLGLLDAEASGQRFLYRTAASFVRVRAGIEPRPPLSAEELRPTGAGGLIVVGSYVERTTEQLTTLLAQPGARGVELHVPALLAGSEGEVSRVAAEVSRILSTGAPSSTTKKRKAPSPRKQRGLGGEVAPAACDVVLYTSRVLVQAAPGLDAVAIGDRITAALCDILARLEQRPGFLVVKGGSTAHGIAIRGLGMKRAVVLGQLLAGVPVWQLGPESKYPDLPYVVFPGNVGGPDALAQAVRTLRGDTDASPRF